MRLYRSDKTVQYVVLVVLLLGGAVICTGCQPDGARGEPWQFADQQGDTGESTAPEDQFPLVDCRENLPPTGTFLETGGDTPRASIEVGPHGCPHVGYYQGGTLNYGCWNGEEWESEILDDLEGYRSHDLHVDGSGQASMAFERRNVPELVWALRGANGSWEQEVIAELWTWDLVYTLDGRGRPLIVVLTSSQQNRLLDSRLVAFTRMQGSWQRDVIDSSPEAIALQPPIALDEAGRPHISYSAASERSRINLAIRDADEPSAWRVQAVREGEGVSQESSVSVVDGAPHILSCRHYFFSDQQTVDYYTPSQDGWVRESLAECQDSACTCYTIRSDDRDRVHLLYGTESSIEGAPNVDLRYTVFGRAGSTTHEFGSVARTTVSMGVDRETGVVHILKTRGRPQENGYRDRIPFYVSVVPPIDDSE